MNRIIDEIELNTVIKNTKKALLLEPPYTRKYLPLGLARIATSIKNNGGSVDFSRVWIPDNYDTVFATSLFTYDSKKVLQSITGLQSDICKNANLYVGGVYASLMPEHIIKHSRAFVFKGCSLTLDYTPPDYSVDWKLEADWNKYSYCFTSRGCPNKCAYCAVWRIEPKPYIIENWKSHIDLKRPWIMVSDNNLSAQPIAHLEDVIKFIYDNKKTALFNNGFDCKHITPEVAKLLGKIKYKSGGGMRVAFDRIEEDGILQDAVKLLIKYGVNPSSILSFVLFNFNDTPQEANYRMIECLKLGIRPYPQQYTPLNCTSRDNVFIGKYWTLNLVRAFRFFWLMAGCYKKTDFITFVKTTDKYELTEEDFEKWYYKKGN